MCWEMGIIFYYQPITIIMLQKCCWPLVGQSIILCRAVSILFCRSIDICLRWQEFEMLKQECTCMYSSVKSILVFYWLLDWVLVKVPRAQNCSTHPWVVDRRSPLDGEGGCLVLIQRAWPRTLVSKDLFCRFLKRVGTL